MNERDTLVQFLHKCGYTHLRWLADGTLIGVAPQAFTYGLFVGLDAIGYERRYCYENGADVLAAITAWDGRGDPPGPWVKVKGEATGDRLGPGAVDWIGPP